MSNSLNVLSKYKSIYLKIVLSITHLVEKDSIFLQAVHILIYLHLK